MRNMLVLLLLFALVSLSGAQTHEYLNDRTVLNYNHNWGAAYMDTLHLKAGTDTLLLTGTRPGYHVIVQPLDGDVYLQLKSTWSHWWKVIDGNPFSLSGGQRDSLFLKTAELDSSIVQVMWVGWE
jgi:hypothetical protein